MNRIYPIAVLGRITANRFIRINEDRAVGINFSLKCCAVLIDNVTLAVVYSKLKVSVFCNHVPRLNAIRILYSEMRQEHNHGMNMSCAQARNKEQQMVRIIFSTPVRLRIVYPNNNDSIRDASKQIRVIVAPIFPENVHIDCLARLTAMATAANRFAKFGVQRVSKVWVSRPTVSHDKNINRRTLGRSEFRTTKSGLKKFALNMSHNFRYRCDEYECYE